MSNTLSAIWFDRLDPTLVISLTAAIFVALWFLRATNKPNKKTTSDAAIQQLLPPGPRGLPLVGYLPFLGTKDLHREFARLAGVYGPIYKFWLGNKLCVVITSPSLVEQVVRDQDTVFANRDVTISVLIATQGGHDIAFSPYSQNWKKLRKIFVREMLNNAVLENLARIRKEEVRKTISHIKSDWIGKPVPIRSMAFLTAINAVMSMSCGTSTQLGAEAEEGEGYELRKAAEELVVLLGKPNVSDLFPGIAWLDVQGVERRTRKVFGVFDGIFDSIIENRRRMMAKAVKGNGKQDSKETRKDFLQFLLEVHEYEDADTPLTMAEVKALLIDIFLGATDTSTTTVEWVMSELLKHPEAMSKVYEELSQVVGSNSKVEEPHLSKLTYLNAVIKETFRLHPPLPFLLPRFPSKSTTLGGYEIPKGTKIFLNVWALQRDPSVWENPSEFKPERFLTCDANRFNAASGNNFNYLPFGSGRRICAGIPLAERMVIYILASFLHSFEWKLPPGAKLELSDKIGIVLKKKEALLAIPTPRLSDPELYT